MSRNSCLPGCLAVAGLAAIAAGGAYFYFRGQLPWQKFTPLEAARVVPEQAFATGFVSTDPKAWSVLAKYGTPAARDAVNRGLETFRKDLATDNLDYGRDIEPWIGGIGIAFLPATGGEPGVLLVVGIKDKLKAAEFAEKLSRQKDRTVTERDYQGVKITEMTSKTGDRTYRAVVSDYLLVAADRAVIEKAIDTYQGKPSFADRSGVKELMTSSLDLQNPLARMYIDDYAGMVASRTKLPPESLKQLQTVRGIVAGVGAAGGGLHFQAVARVAPDTLTAIPAPAGDRFLNYFPNDTLIFWNGNNLKQGWNELDRRSTDNPNLQTILREIRTNLQMATLDADRDIFGWMDGGFAFGVIPSSRSLGGVGIGGLMLWETSDRPTAEKTLEKLNRLTTFVPGIAIDKTPIDGKEVTRWQSGGQTLLTYGWSDNNSLVVTLGIPFQSQPPASIAANPTFQQAIASFPKQNLGYFYFDVAGFFEKTGFLATLPPGQIQPEARALLESVRGIAMTATLSDKTTSKVDAMLTLKEVP
jgi:hypothetical protein